ncbi:hypothetical protein EJB05_33339, partial [Eragrostis curvula]
MGASSDVGEGAGMKIMPRHGLASTCACSGELKMTAHTHRPRPQPSKGTDFESESSPRKVATTAKIDVLSRRGSGRYCCHRSSLTSPLHCRILSRSTQGSIRKKGSNRAALAQPTVPMTVQARHACEYTENFFSVCSDL